MSLKAGEKGWTTVWNKLPQRRLKQIHDYIKYKKLEPLSAEKLKDELLDFGDKLVQLQV